MLCWHPSFYHPSGSGQLRIKIAAKQVRETWKAAERENMKPIIIKTYPVKESKSKLVKLRPDANAIVLRMQRESGLSKTHIVCEIIKQAYQYVQFQEEEIED